MAVWLTGKLKDAGYQASVLPEDWGRCVICQRAPFLLWVGCGNVRDFEKNEQDDPPPRGADVAWHCFVEAEPTLFARLFKRVDVGPALDKLDADLRTILSHEAGIELIPAP